MADAAKADTAKKEAPVPDKAVPTPSKSMVRGYASNEFVFAVVGHVGSGTTKIATSLAELLNKGSITGDPFDTEIIKARELIEAWATETERQFRLLSRGICIRPNNSKISATKCDPAATTPPWLIELSSVFVSSERRNRKWMIPATNPWNRTAVDAPT